MAASPPPPELLAALNEGVNHHRTGMLDAAERCYRRALAIAPDDHNALRLITGLALYRENWPVALEFARRAVDVQPGHAELHRLLAVALMENGDPHGAIAMAERALELGDGPLARLVLANANFRKGDNEAAAKIYREILRREPTNAAAHFNLGKLLLHLGTAGEGERHLAQALEIEPNHIEALRTLGRHFVGADQPRKAVNLLHHAATLRPDDSDLQRILGETLNAVEQYAEAMRAFRAVLEKQPGDLEAQLGLAFALIKLSQPVPALRLLEKILADDPGNVGAGYIASLAQDRLFMMPESTANLARAAADPAASSLRVQAWAYRLLLTEGISQAQIFEAHRDWSRRFADPITEHLPRPAPQGRADKKLRIGYVSPDLRRHSMAYFIEPVLRHHDRSQFQIYCYDAKGLSDTVNARLRGLADQWRDIADLDDQQAAALIARDRIDILIDMAGFTEGNRLTLFAAWPAPVQATWLGYPATTAMAAIDWRIVDVVTEPPGIGDKFSTERLLRGTRGPLVFAPPAADIAPTRLAIDDDDAVVFCSCNNLAKLQPGVIDAWARILAAVPDARLMLKDTRLAEAQVGARVAAEFARRGVSTERLRLQGHTGLDEHLRSYGKVDIGLDTFPYNGGTTTCEALWMGVPVVALEGESYVGRMGMALLRQGGFDQWIAPTIDAYVAKAVALAGEVGALRGRRPEIRQQFLAKLCDGPAFMADFERGLRSMWTDAVAARDAGQAAPAASAS